MDLCAVQLPRPIHTAADARATSWIVNSLAGFPLNPDQEDYLEALAHSLNDYDREHAESLPQASARGVLAYLVDERGITGAELSRILGGSRNLGTMILRGDRALTLPHVRRLADYFGVAPGAFID